LKIEKQHIKPYLFVILFMAIPVIIFQVFKKVFDTNTVPNSNSTYIIDNKDTTTTENSNTVHNQDTTFFYGIVIHGGAGDIVKGKFSPQKEVQYKTKLYEALQTGMSKLDQGDSAIYVVEAVIKILEDSPLFNAGKGAVKTIDGNTALDASIMNGLNKDAGAVAGVSTIKNPISVALAVMQHSNYVMLSGYGAEQFAREQGIELVSSTYFADVIEPSFSKYGTVGCVVLDRYHNLAAGTSTGGIKNKAYGRIGDSPVIGAGTYADNNTCAISTTGIGEYFIRLNVAYDISAQMKYAHQKIDKAAENALNQVELLHGSGGVIGIDRFGTMVMKFNTPGMFRGFCQQGKEPQVLLYNE